jgi:hypothetical protein
MEQVQNNEFIVQAIFKTSHEYQERLEKHTTGNIDNGLHDLLIIAGLEYHSNWTEGSNEVLGYAQRRLRQLRNMSIDNIELFLKNVTVVQNNLELLGKEKFTNDHERNPEIILYADDYASQPAKVSHISDGTRNARNPAEFSSTCMRTGSKLNLWIGDSGASCHMTCSEDGLTECRKIQSPVRIGKGHMLMATKIDKKHVTVVQRDGTITELVGTNCKYLPKLFTNLFSIAAAIKHGWNISNQGQEI